MGHSAEERLEKRHSDLFIQLSAKRHFSFLWQYKCLIIHLNDLNFHGSISFSPDVQIKLQYKTRSIYGNDQSSAAWIPDLLHLFNKTCKFVVCWQSLEMYCAPHANKANMKLFLIPFFFFCIYSVHVSEHYSRHIYNSKSTLKSSDNSMTLTVNGM